MYKFYYHLRETVAQAQYGSCRDSNGDYNSDWLSPYLQLFLNSVRRQVEAQNVTWPQHVTVVDLSGSVAGKFVVRQITARFTCFPPVLWYDIFPEHIPLGPLWPKMTKAEYELYCAPFEIQHAERKIIA